MKHDTYLQSLRKFPDQTVNDFYPFPIQALVLTCLQKKSLENTAEKGDIARYEQFLLFPQCFLPVLRAFCHFHQT